MSYICGTSRNQWMMAPLDSMVDSRSIARVIDSFVESLNLAELGIKESPRRAMGRPSYSPRLFLKLYIYGYQDNIRSSRKLEKACRNNLEVKWLVECLEPDHRTISEFRRANIEGLEKVFYLFGEKISGAVKKGYDSVDGTKIAAANGKDSNFTACKLDDRIAWGKEKIEEYLRLIEQIDEEEEKADGLPEKSTGEETELSEEFTKEEAGEELPGESEKEEADEELSEGFTKEELEKKLEDLRERMERYEGYRKYMEENGLTQLSLTDADAKLMKSKNGYIVAYNVQAAVDSETHLIDTYRVTDNPTDHGELAPTMKPIQEKAGGIVESVADSGYDDPVDMANCLENGIVPNVIPANGSDTKELELPYEPAEITEEDRRSTKPEDLKRCLRGGIIPMPYERIIKEIEVVERRKLVNDGEGTAEEKKLRYGTIEEMIARASEGFFVRDPERDLVVCPAGKILRRKSVKKNGDTRYANKTACRKCPCRDRCYKGKNDFKEVDFNKDTLEKPNRNWIAEAEKELANQETENTVEVAETTEAAESAETESKDKKKNEVNVRKGHYVKETIVRIVFKPDRKKMDNRKCLSEHPFGTVKRAMGGGHFLLKGKKKVSGETALLFLGYNIKRALNLLGFEKLMGLVA